MKRRNLVLIGCFALSLVGILTSSVIANIYFNNKGKVEIVFGNLESLDDSKLNYYSYGQFGRKRITTVASSGISKKTTYKNENFRSIFRLSKDYVVSANFNSINIEGKLTDDILQLTLKSEEINKKIKIDIEEFKKATNVAGIDYLDIIDARLYDDELKIVYYSSFRNLGTESKVISININTSEIYEEKALNGKINYADCYLGKEYLYFLHQVKEKDRLKNVVARASATNFEEIELFEAKTDDTHIRYNMHLYEEFVLIMPYSFDNTMVETDLITINTETDEIKHYKDINVFSEEEVESYMIYNLYMIGDKLAVNYYKDNNSITLLADDDIFTRIINIESNEVILELKANNSPFHL